MPTYSRATGVRLGLITNFNAPVIWREINHAVLSPLRPAPVWGASRFFEKVPTSARVDSAHQCDASDASFRASDLFMTSLLLRCGVAGPILFMLVFMGDGAIRQDYRPWRHFVSLLARGARGWVQAVNFIICGCLSLCFAAGLAQTVDGLAFPALFTIFGVGLVASGIFPCDAGLGYPREAPATWPRTATRNGNLHNLAGALVFGSLSIATFVAAGRSESRGFAIYSVATGVIVLVLFVTAGALAAGVRDESADPPIGFTQRLAIGAGWTWMAVFAISVAG